MRAVRWCLASALGLALPAGANGFVADWEPVPESTLAQVRGGFGPEAQGLLLTLGIERVVDINGQVVASSRIALADSAGLTGRAAALAQTALAPVVLQNSVNGQLIRTLTTIDLTVNALSTLKAFNLEGSLRQALSTVSLPR